MIIGMWNYAVKVRDLRQASGFYTEHLGGEIQLQGTVLGSQYVLIRLGQTRLLLMDRAPYEQQLGLDLAPGLLHLVFEVDDFDSHLDRLRRSGVRFLTEPQVIQTDFDRRRIVFFETPEGIRTEIMQVLD